MIRIAALVGRSSRSFSTEIVKNIPYAGGAMRSNAMEKIMGVEPIGVDGNIAVCDGGGGALGHPIEYINLHFTTNNADKRVELDGICKWCGLRFFQKGGQHGHH
ncbi:hypothetical protein ScalyP_jg7388 [Parmales sp. scaly parma]|nr:hypothetical protein ScalyP_jg7388 [Parmales sp. scaly parma]